MDCGTARAAFGVRQFIAALEYFGLRHVSCRFGSRHASVPLRDTLGRSTSPSPSGLRHASYRFYDPLNTTLFKIVLYFPKRNPLLPL